MNRYVYCINNPVMGIDPSGYMSSITISDGGSGGIKPKKSATSKLSSVKEEQLKKIKEATTIKNMVDNYESDLAKELLKQKSKTIKEEWRSEEEISWMAFNRARKALEEKFQKALGFTPDGIGETPQVDAEYIYYDSEGKRHSDPVPIDSASYNINHYYCLESMQGRSINSIMDSLSIWDNMQYIKDNPRQGNPYYLDNGYTEEVLYYSIFGEQETKMEMIQQFVLQFDGDKTSDKTIAALGMEDNILGSTDLLLTYASTPRLSMDMASDCTAFAGNIFAIFNTTENLTNREKGVDSFGIGKYDSLQTTTDLYKEGNTNIGVGDFVYLDNDKNGTFDHVVLVIGIDNDGKHIYAHASGTTDNFKISYNTINLDEVMGTLNILGETP